jgi:hypothetical protein
MKIKIYRLPWWVAGITRLKGKFILDLGYFSIWIMWGKNEKA